MFSQSAEKACVEPLRIPQVPAGWDSQLLSESAEKTCVEPLRMPQVSADWDNELIVVSNGFEFSAFTISQPAEEACEETTCSPHKSQLAELHSYCYVTASRYCSEHHSHHSLQSVNPGLKDISDHTYHTHKIHNHSLLASEKHFHSAPGSAFIKPDQRNPWIKDQLGNSLLSTISHLQLPNFVSCGRDKPSHMTQNLVTVGAKL